DNSSNDGVLECNVYSKSVLHLIVEMKNEIGTSGCDSTYNWPSFLLCLARPWVCILGAIYVKKLIIDLLTDFIPLIPTNDRAYTERVARLFKALHLGVNKLTEYYGSLDALTDP
ncbi:7903_t:CDS:2, partial [Dentiscutata heterogama]